MIIVTGHLLVDPELRDDYLEGHDVDDAIAELIEARYLATEHKRRVPASPVDEWWRS